MLVRLKLEGGFAYIPGIHADRLIDTDALPEAQANTVQKLVKSAHFFDLPEHLGEPNGHIIDRHRYTITVEDEEHVHTVEAPEPVEDPHLATLLAYLQELGLDGDHDPYE